MRLNIADMRDEHGLRYLVQNQDVIFNLAGQVSHTDSMADPYADLEINARSQLSLSRSVPPQQSRSVHRLCQHAPDLRPSRSTSPSTNCTPCSRSTSTASTRRAGEMYHIVYHNVYGLKTVSLRLTNTYGPRMRVKDARQTFLGWWLRQIVEGQTLQIFGDGPSDSRLQLRR